MANVRPQTEKLKKLNLLMCECGRLFSAKLGAHCKKCGPNETPAIATKTCRKGHVRNADVKRCSECDKARKAKPADEDPAPAISDAQRAQNRADADSRKAKRMGLGLEPLPLK